MSGQLKRTNLLAVKRSRAYSSKRNLADGELSRLDLSPSLQRVSSPTFSTPKAFLSPYATLKKEPSRRIKSRGKPCNSDLKSSSETLNRSYSCLQSTPKLSKNSSKAKPSPGEVRWSITPKEERSTNNSRLLASSKLENGMNGSSHLHEEESPESGFAMASNLMEELTASHPRLSDVLALIRTGYEQCIEQLTTEVLSTQQSLSMLKLELDSSRKQITSLQTLLATMQERTGLSNIGIQGEELNVCRRQNEFLVQVLRYMNGRGYPVKAAYAEVQRQAVSTADSGDSLGTGEWKQGASCVPNEKEGKCESKHKVVIPRLKLPQEQRPDFQEEFFSKLEEFSESWKIQIPKSHKET